jgi:hypothetical protein
MRKMICAAMVLTLLSGNVAWAQSALEATLFRPGGHVSLLAAVQQTAWDVTKAGAVVGKKELHFSPGVVARYAFHFQLIKKFGGVVGTDVGVFHDWANVGETQSAACSGSAFRPGTYFSFPSMTLGLVQNLSEKHRAAILGQYTGIMFPWMKTCLENGETQLLSAIPHSFAMMGQWDRFLESGAAISVAVGYRNTGIQCVGKQSVCVFGAEKTSALENLDFSARGIVVQIGMTWPTGTETQP